MTFSFELVSYQTMACFIFISVKIKMNAVDLIYLRPYWNQFYVILVYFLKQANINLNLQPWLNNIIYHVDSFVGRINDRLSKWQIYVILFGVTGYWHGQQNRIMMLTIVVNIHTSGLAWLYFAWIGFIERKSFQFFFRPVSASSNVRKGIAPKELKIICMFGSF